MVRYGGTPLHVWLVQTPFDRLLNRVNSINAAASADIENRNLCPFSPPLHFVISGGLFNFRRCVIDQRLFS